VLFCRMYKYHFVSKCFNIDAVMDDMNRKFFKLLSPQSTVCILYSLQSKAIHMGKKSIIIGLFN